MKTAAPIVCLILTLTLLPLTQAQQRDVPNTTNTPNTTDATDTPNIPEATTATGNPFARFTHAWRDDPVWYDGLAECAVYDATRTIYGKQRNYTARIFTNKEHFSPNSFTKSADATGREVFKHHTRDEIPTEEYTYYYSTMAYVGTDDLKSLKLDMGSQEDCGATFKQYINHAGELAWVQFSYFPNQGHKQGGYAPPPGFVFQDALSLVLRGYPFDDPPKTLDVAAIPDQTNNKLSGSQPLKSVITYEGKETLGLPFGEVQAHHVRFYHNPAPQDGDPPKPPAFHDYWFAADPAMQHIMVQYSGPGGQTYKLRSVQRRAYWR